MNKNQYLKALINNDIDIAYISDCVRGGELNFVDAHDIWKEWGEWLDKSIDKGVGTMQESADIDSWFPAVDDISSDVISNQGNLYTWGSPNADKVFTHIESHHSIIVYGTAGSGKTTFTTDVAWKCSQLGNDVLYVSIEMNADTLLTSFGRKAAAITKAQWREKRLISQAQKDIYHATKKKFTENKKLELFGLKAGESNCITHVLDIAEAKNPNLILIDNMGLLSFSGEMEKDERLDEAISRYCQLWTNQKEIPVIMIHHVNKAGEMAGSQKIKNNSDGVFFCERNMDANEKDPLEKKKFIVVEEKDRDFGEFGMNTFIFDKGTFRDMNNSESQDGFD